MINEVLDAFKDIEDGVIVDCTLGYGGHSEAILNNNKNIKIIACDRDEEAINYSKKRLEKYNGRIEMHKTTFSNLVKNIDLKSVRGILADIGVSSLHLDKNDRGFSVKSDVLDMRMNKESSLDAKFVVNNYTQDRLEEIFKEYGELKDARNTAKKIVDYRAKKEITSAKELANLIGLNPVRGNSGISRATLAFQAIRIEVNKELEELESLLTTIQNSDIKHAIVAIISFHSLEDRMVKNYFKKWSKNCICPEFFIKCECGGDNAIGKIISKKAIVAKKDEILNNSRSKSAKLRVFEIDR
ncbi:16S rRNA m4C1402 methyltransferase [Campylobacter blaseri]|nr:16S rRNA m4C1402 methyltransferase [Campylobacter blaseri]